MKDYDVIVIGGGINGLTVATYLQKAGLSVGVFEARGQCGAFCDTVELGQSGFLHNTHASWIVPAMSPAMADLELERHGLDLRGCDVLFAKPFRDQTNTLLVHGSDIGHNPVSPDIRSTTPRWWPRSAPTRRSTASRPSKSIGRWSSAQPSVDLADRAWRDSTTG